ncbi:killer cell lectin-like receptor subfamily E member 1 [Choloepus didactylus]|uniref:killer cell lectin-like receptor subfamily E member 1 n=1 Tax=Choloepus didactylus TaxID=27675 RepID=UPI00189D3096|nr:killer cell lectin-like receptor subfamily E member 1 [Choloepus didactylus]XP_037702356.1 killer cell lectin-like receptor subfamily E member 1 [Choloepus didactylus]
MNEEPIIYVTLNQDSWQKHTYKNNTEYKFSPNELSLTKKELKHHKPCKEQHKNSTEDVSGKDFSPLPWRLMSVVLGVTCFFLMAIAIAVAAFTGNSSSKETYVTTQQKGPRCHSCPKNWVWFRCSCYYFSKEQLTWRESQQACLSKNASLLKINKEEVHFFSLKSFFWIGIYHNGIDKQWLWENDSTMSSDIFSLPRYQRQQICLSYKSREVYVDESCENKQTYICKKPLFYFTKSQER